MIIVNFTYHRTFFLTEELAIWQDAKNQEISDLEKTPEQVPEHVSDKLHTNDKNIIRLVKTIGTEELSVIEIMSRLELKHRPNFLEYTLNPSLREGYVCMRYPDKPKHPRQKYLLTVKGAVFYNELVRVESC